MNEIKVRPVTRYIVTSYHAKPPAENGHQAAGCEEIGEFNNASQADNVAGAVYERARSAGKAVSVQYSDGEVSGSD